MIEGYAIKVGTRVITDGRLAHGGVFGALDACTHWDAAEFVIEEEVFVGVPALAANVEITGRKVRFGAPGLGNTPVVRVKVTFPGDGEPDTVVGGWAIAADC